MNWESNADKELWILKSGELAIPFYCRPGSFEKTPGTFWMIQTAIFAGSQFRQMISMLDPLLHSSTPEGKFIEDSVLRNHFTKAPGVTPEFYFTSKVATGGKKVTIKVDPKLMDDSARDKVDMGFVDWVAERTTIMSQKDLRIVWLTFATMAPQYLLQKLNPIDFGFARLHALPYRASWKAIMMAKFPRIYRWLRQKPLWKNFEISPYATESRKTDLIGIRPHGGGHVISWTLEMEPSKLWNEYSLRVEQSANTSLSPRAYLVRVGELFDRFWPVQLPLLRAYADSASLPCGDIVNPGDPSKRRLVAYIPEGAVAPVEHPHPPADYVCDAGESGLYSASFKSHRKGEGSYVHEMPFVPLYPQTGPDDGDVRQTGGDGGNTDGPPAGGVLVPDQAEKSSP